MGECSRFCKHEECQKFARFGVGGQQKEMFCEQHKLEEMVDMYPSDNESSTSSSTSSEEDAAVPSAEDGVATSSEDESGASSEHGSAPPSDNESVTPEHQSITASVNESVASSEHGAATPSKDGLAPSCEDESTTVSSHRTELPKRGRPSVAETESVKEGEVVQSVVESFKTLLLEENSRRAAEQLEESTRRAAEQEKRDHLFFSSLEASQQRSQQMFEASQQRLQSSFASMLEDIQQRSQQVFEDSQSRLAAEQEQRDQRLFSFMEVSQQKSQQFFEASQQRSQLMFEASQQRLQQSLIDSLNQSASIQHKPSSSTSSEDDAAVPSAEDGVATSSEDESGVSSEHGSAPPSDSESVTPEHQSITASVNESVASSEHGAATPSKDGLAPSCEDESTTVSWHGKELPKSGPPSVAEAESSNEGEVVQSVVESFKTLLLEENSRRAAEQLEESTRRAAEQEKRDHLFFSSLEASQQRSQQMFEASQQRLQQVFEDSQRRLAAEQKQRDQQFFSSFEASQQRLQSSSTSLLEDSQRRLAAEQERRDQRLFSFLEASQQSQQSFQKSLIDSLNQSASIQAQTFSSILSPTLTQLSSVHSPILSGHTQESGADSRGAVVDDGGGPHAPGDDQGCDSLINVTAESAAQCIEGDSNNEVKSPGSVNSPTSPHMVSRSDLNINTSISAIALTPTEARPRPSPQCPPTPAQLDVNIDRSHLSEGVRRAEEFNIRKSRTEFLPTSDGSGPKFLNPLTHAGARPGPSREVSPSPLLLGEVDIETSHLGEGVRRAEEFNINRITNERAACPTPPNTVEAKPSSAVARLKSVVRSGGGLRLKFSPTKPTAAQKTSPNINTDKGGITDPFLSQRADNNRTMVAQHQRVPFISRSITARAGNRRHYNTAVTDHHELNESLLRSSADIEASESSTIIHEYDFSPNNHSVSSPIPIIDINRSITARAGNRRHYNAAVTDHHELNESLLRSSADIEASDSSTITHEYDFSPNNYSVSSPIPIIEVVGPERRVRNSKGRSTKW
eukprot:CAMPEP_0194745248 /NCGR_PEP_ID=MMETSP0296-20130528/101309_1 /TAXON_ID=39354 /ORGANISM="Heterosigma akashiwo, Strain CCMP2393" /LENGTH=1023 /DNA_ID=CAMNT_0039657463 /DNA_START=428 /DNA_END=3497 /DNA_ORIENTATION=-